MLEDVKEIKNTDEWNLYEQAVQYASIFNMYDETDKDYRFYNGDQWAGLKIEGVEPIQLNFISTIVDYKIAVINQNLWGIVYSSENFENREFKPYADELCKLLNLRANKIWERTKMDMLVRLVSIDSAITGEGIIYTYWDKNEKIIYNELLNNVDVYYGNENSTLIQDQPYILIRKRMPVSKAREYARNLDVSEEKVREIVADNDNIHNAGDDSEYEKDETCTVIVKMWKEKGKIHYSEATQHVQLIKNNNSGLTRYPLAHFIWSIKKGFARGEGVVSNLIPNQIETNKILMRRAFVTKSVAYPQKVANIDYIQNPQAINNVGATIEVTGATDNVNNVFSSTVPAQMSTDVQALQNDLIDLSRNLQNAGDISTGSINPESASGKAILAVQNASQQTLNSQVQYLKDFIEDVALNWLDAIVTYGNNIVLQSEDTDPRTGQKSYTNIKIPNSALKSLKASVKVDVTPMSPYDQYAQELSLENLLKEGWFRPENVDQLEVYVNALPDKSTMPKQKLQEIIKNIKDKQLYIQQLQANTEMAYSNANQYIDSENQGVQDNLAGIGVNDETEEADNQQEGTSSADEQAMTDAIRDYLDEEGLSTEEDTKKQKKNK